MNLRRNRKRSTWGGQIAEFGPALILFFFFILFPLMELIYIATGYGAAWYLSHSTVRELTLANPTVAGSAQAAEAKVQLAWANTGLAKLIGIDSTNYTQKVTQTNLTYTPSLATPNFVSLTTSVVVKPFVTISLLANVPGVGSNLTFTFTEQQPMEEKGQD